MLSLPADPIDRAEFKMGLCLYLAFFVTLFLLLPMWAMWHESQ